MTSNVYTTTVQKAQAGFDDKEYNEPILIATEALNFFPRKLENTFDESVTSTAIKLLCIALIACGMISKFEGDINMPRISLN